MQSIDLHAVTFEHAGAKLGVAVTQPFGPGADVFKLRDKMFCMTMTYQGAPAVTLKCDPERSRFLRDIHPSIIPGYHMNKQHWITVTAGPGVDAELLTFLLDEAYALIWQSLPKAQRPPLAPG